MTNQDAYSEAPASYEVGFGKPPRSTRFRKGMSGNPKGRPKGSKSLAIVLAQMGRQRVKVTINGKVRNLSRLEMMVMQLSNKAASGDLKAIRELLIAHRIFAEPEQTTEALEVFQEQDTSVMRKMLTRIRSSEVRATDENQASETPEAE